MSGCVRIGRRLAIAGVGCLTSEAMAHVLRKPAPSLSSGGAAHTVRKTHRGVPGTPAIHRNVAAPLPVVMLDPGHGGKDPGAIGVSGTYEKHIAEAAASELQRQLIATRRYRVVLTRDSDRFIPLEGRVELAQRHGAHLFVSMHADALHDPNVRGASVYTLSRHASDTQTAALAKTENSADRFAGPSFHGMSPEVQQILSSLVSEETERGSAHMASSIVSSFGTRIRLLANPSRHAAFVVLKSAEIPSVLVEMGFMSNRLDEAALRQAVHRTQIASAMCEAVKRYFASQPSNMVLAG
ncbi:N-acetylmuramoyl-L-alanine amidase family protein [Brytella acorum]|uniref:N-acetylmuramoyl-L-alanine amidase n=1 Tax=Brytella acorum TaxID=2959299 RepID=A0AA35Y2L4_9PROT|nr:N-acetylmuramoyl-L-alanine amidase [Brytella acorum]MDF3623606.1 N-acetylmuramoyl-L-alanine amidase [Brytella acorum]CAI9119976.1 N-acetylmuramoyl-L-alanine amidase [Brytella acorum]